MVSSDPASQSEYSFRRMTGAADFRPALRFPLTLLGIRPVYISPFQRGQMVRCEQARNMFQR